MPRKGTSEPVGGDHQLEPRRDESTASAVTPVEREVLEFPAGVALTTVQADQTFMLLASDAKRGLIRYAPWGERPRTDTRRVFVVSDGRFAPVRLYAHVLGPPEGEDAETCVVVKWVMLTATERRENLAQALEGLLGVRAVVTDSDEPLGPHRKLIYDAETQQVRLIWVERSNQVRTGAGTAERGSDRAVRQPKTPSKKDRLKTATEAKKTQNYGSYGEEVPPPTVRKTQPRILVQLSEASGSDALSTPSRQDASGRFVSDGTGRFSPRRSTGQSAAGEGDPGIVLREARRGRAHRATPTPVGSFGFSRSLGGRSGKREPLYHREDAAGKFRRKGEEKAHAVTFGWIGRAACVFFVGPGEGPELGGLVEVGIPGEPVVDGLIWVQGTVALLTVDRTGGQSMVEVDLAGNRQPAQYDGLVGYWKRVQTDR